MKTILLAAALTAITNLHAVSIDWLADSPSAFDVTITFTGPSLRDTITSPSGLWQLGVDDWFIYNSYAAQFGTPIEIGGAATMSFLPLPLHYGPGDQYWPAMLSAGPWDDYFFATNPISNRGNGTNIGNPWNYYYGYMPQDWLLNSWQETNPITLVSMPCLSDDSTWVWSVRYRGHGSTLPVPEGGSAWLLMALASAVLLCFRLKVA